ncbi:MAG: iron ABC transporter permease [Vallitalea sp.]|jgi:iron complex transport system permease protein|nr:iron ABC transporter permease [Vallitalea sp.]
MNKIRKDILKGSAGCIILMILIFILILIAIKVGSIEVTYKEIFEGLFVKFNRKIYTIYNLRFPRIIVALLGGASLSLSGLLFQAILRNPLADPGVIGICGGASFTALIISTFFPSLYFYTPIIAFIGGFLAFILIYSLAWKESLDPTKIILIGIAVASIFTGLSEILKGMANRTGVLVSVSGLTQLVWEDVKVLFIYSIIGIIGAIIIAPACNILELNDKTVRGLGVNINVLRFIISIVAVLLASGITAVVGVIGFLGLIVPHIARKIIGADHRILVPFCTLLGGFTLLLADTLGRLIAIPNEIPAAIIMSVIGGPFFIILLKRSDNHAKH